MGLIRTLFFIVLVYYLLKFLGRIFAPMLFGYAAKKAGQRFNDAYTQQQKTNRRTSKEGETIIDKAPKKKSNGSSSGKQVGEYIDFEELD